MRHVLLVALAIFAALLPVSAFAQDGTNGDGGFVLRVSGDYWLRGDEEADTVVVIDGHARIDGVAQSLLVISGSATVTGRVEDDITMIRSDLDLQRTAVVDNVSVFRGDLTRSAGATITGELDESDGQFLWAGWWILFGFVMFIGMTIFVIAAGLLFAAVGGRQLREAAESMSAEPGKTIAAGLIMVVGLPVAAVIALITIVGIPVGVGLLVMALPLLGLLGHLVAGTWLGTLILRPREPAKHPYREAALGLLLLQLVIFVPGVGGLAFVAGVVWGTGAIALMAWRGMRGRAMPGGEAPTAAAVGGGMPHPA
ncbi:MAG: hypothetical protein C0506_03200 [Anaerolinea sp.]|nr:hypothetical protein [Anaerolinea sp.]